MPPTRPRYAPDAPLPPYAFVSPHWPHPRRHPEGHSAGAPEPTAPPLDPDGWARSLAYRQSIDLFNHGYYWEAHEGWEALWNAAGRTGPTAELMKGLIKLAAAGVKGRQGRLEGVRRHAERAAEHLRAAARATGRTRMAGLALEELALRCETIAARPEALRGDPTVPVDVVYPWCLVPTADEAPDGPAPAVGHAGG